MVKQLTTMSDVREPFNLTEDSSRDAELLAVGSGEHALGEYSVHVEGPGGASGLASVQADGSFSFTRRNVRPSNSMALECTGMQGRRRLDYPTRYTRRCSGRAPQPPVSPAFPDGGPQTSRWADTSPRRFTRILS